MARKPKKWATLHQFGKKKRKKRRQRAAGVSSTPSRVGDSTTIASSSTDSALREVASALNDAPIADTLAESAPTSAKKPRRFESEVMVPSPHDYMIVNMSTLKQLVSTFPCEKCGQPYTVTEDKAARMGSSCKLLVQCVACASTINEVMTSPKSGTGHKGFDIRLVVAATSAGIGFTQLKRFFALLNLPPPMQLKTWQHYKKALDSGNHQAADEHLDEAAEKD